jgi:polygalacturonase
MGECDKMLTIRHFYPIVLGQTKRKYYFCLQMRKANNYNPSKNKSTIMKQLILAATLLLFSASSFGQDNYSRYYENLPVSMPMVATPNIPDRRVSLTDFGAKGDGLTMNTEAFAKAISTLAKAGGGHLDVPAGIYLTGLISLKDNIDLHLDRNATILFSPDKRDLLKQKNANEPVTKASPCLTASKRTNISITGEGVIDGNGEYWRPVKRGKVSDVEWNQYKALGGTEEDGGKLWYPFGLKHYPDVAPNAKKQDKMRAHLVRITDCSRVLIQGVTLRNSPNFHLVPQRCTNVVIDNVKVVCPWNAQNGDAFDITNCRNVLIVNNTINAGDDGICMKGGQGQSGKNAGPCENINIQDNRVYHAHGGFVIGSDVAGGMKNIYVHNNTFAGTDTGLRFKSAPGRGGLTQDIYISNIYMTDIKDEAIVFQCNYVDVKAGQKGSQIDETSPFVPHFTDIHISKVVCTNCETGVKAIGSIVKGITVENSTIFYTGKATDIAPECEVKLSQVDFKTYQ